MLRPQFHLHLCFGSSIPSSTMLSQDDFVLFGSSQQDVYRKPYTVLQSSRANAIYKLNRQKILIKQTMAIRFYRSIEGLHPSETVDLQTSGATKKRRTLPCIRYLMSILAFLGFANIYGMRVNLSVAIVKMVEKRFSQNGTICAEPDFDWGTGRQGVLLSSFFWGYIVTQLPGGLLSARFGGMKVFSLGVFSTSVLTLLTPVVAHWGGFECLLVLRILEGFGEGVTYPAHHTFWSKWAPNLERTKLVTISFCGSYAGTVISFPVCGFLADYFGWESIFYVFGSCGLAWTLLWCVLASDSPEKNRFVNDEELQVISQSRGTDESDLAFRDVPWRSILTSMPVYAIMLAHFCENWGFYTLLMALPSYLKRALHFDLTSGGFMAALPYLAMGVLLFVSGQMADLLRRGERVSTVAVRKMFLVIGFSGQAAFLYALSHTEDPSDAVMYLTFGAGFGGFAVGAFNINYIDVSPRFSGVIMGLGNALATVPGVVCPYLTGYITSDNTFPEWRIVFCLSSTIYIFGAVVFALFASGHAQSWNSATRLRLDGM